MLAAFPIGTFLVSLSIPVIGAFIGHNKEKIVNPGLFYGLTVGVIIPIFGLALSFIIELWDMVVRWKILLLGMVIIFIVTPDVGGVVGSYLVNSISTEKIKLGTPVG